MFGSFCFQAAKKKTKQKQIVALRCAALLNCRKRKEKKRKKKEKKRKEKKKKKKKKKRKENKKNF